MYDIHSAQGDLFAFVNGGLKPQEQANAPAGAGVTAHDGKVPPPISSTRAQDAPCGRRPVAYVTSNPPAALDGAAIRAAIHDWTELRDAKRRDLLTAVNHAEKILAFNRSQCAGHAPWSCAALNRVLWARPHAAYALNDGTFRNMVSNLRTVLIRLGLHADSRYGANHLSPAWGIFYKSLPTDERRRALVRFFRFLTLQGVTPETVTPEAINAFDAWCRSQILHEDPCGLSRRAAGTWEWARQNVAGWPQIAMHRTGMRDHYALPWSAYPASFQADVERFLSDLAAGPGLGLKPRNPFRSLAEAAQQPDAGKSLRGVQRALTARTIETRRWQIKVAAAALVLSGVPVESIASLCSLVTPVENAAKILEFHEARQRQQKAERGEDVPNEFLRSSQLIGIAEVLRQIGKFEAHLPEAQLAELSAYAAAVAPEQQMQMSEANATRLKGLFAEPAYSLLLHLPRHWMEAAGEPGRRPREAALMAMFATALEILLFLPLRRANCLDLQLDTHLRRPAPNALINEIRLPGRMVKNRATISWPVEVESAGLIETYVRKYRPLLAHPGNPYLFPGLGQAPRNASEFGNALSTRVEKATGTAFNCHLVRYFAVVRYLRQMPGAYETAAQILGHKNPDTTRRFYCGLERDAAARQVNATLAEDRRAAKVIAVGHYHKPQRRRHTGKGVG